LDIRIKRPVSLNISEKGKPVWRIIPFSIKVGTVPTFRKAGTQSHRVCPADSLAAEQKLVGSFLF
jgi:hypothetical protein